MLGRIEAWEEKGTTEDEMVGWHHQPSGHEFEQAPGVGDGQGSLVCCSPWGCKELDMVERQHFHTLFSNNVTFSGSQKWNLSI